MKKTKQGRVRETERERKGFRERKRSRNEMKRKVKKEKWYKKGIIRQSVTKINKHF